MDFVIEQENLFTPKNLFTVQFYHGPMHTVKLWNSTTQSTTVQQLGQAVQRQYWKICKLSNPQSLSVCHSCLGDFTTQSRRNWMPRQVGMCARFVICSVASFVTFSLCAHTTILVLVGVRQSVAKMALSAASERRKFLDEADGVRLLELQTSNDCLQDNSSCCSIFSFRLAYIITLPPVCCDFAGG